MEAWAYRVKRAKIVLMLAGLIFFTGSLSAIVWVLVCLAQRQAYEHLMAILTLALLPIPYLLVYLLSMKKGYSVFRRMRLTRRLRGIPPHAHPHDKAAEVWDWLPFHRQGFQTASPSSLAGKEDPAWLELAEADNAVRLATGSGFDVLVLMKKGPVNLIAGELPGVGTWFCASRHIVEAMDMEDLMAALVHELFHGETGELAARNTALDLHDLGVFATSFVAYYVCVGLIVSSIPADWSLTQLPLLALVVLLLWVAMKLYSRIADRFLFPAGSCPAADAYAGHVLSDPVRVAEAFLVSLRYSVERSDSRHALAGGWRYLCGFMFAPLATSRRRADRQVRRIEALLMQPGRDGVVPHEIAEMNRRIEEVAEEARSLYAKQRAQPSGRLAAVIAYTALFATIAVVLGIGTGKNFLPVRLCLDWLHGGQNTVVEGPGSAGNTVTIYGSQGDGAAGYIYLSPSRLTVVVKETVTWSNQGDREQVIVGDGIPRSPVLKPGEEYTVSINRSGRFTYHVLDASGEEEGVEGELYAYY
ncbi:MAG: hypothetical protein C4536_01755 [Actinobacteria bacterium]|jgi:hypothetical protein|nr:MAG: hypothetical protein C4536_01755 [Actinomycetota bacterium]